jgi:hypothetical protein
MALRTHADAESRERVAPRVEDVDPLDPHAVAREGAGVHARTAGRDSPVKKDSVTSVGIF